MVIQILAITVLTFYIITASVVFIVSLKCMPTVTTKNVILALVYSILLIPFTAGKLIVTIFEKILDELENWADD